MNRLSMPLYTGARLGRYVIVTPIGAGGMGEVYLATDTKLKRDVALKVLPEAFANDSERMARFEREAQVLAALNHPNIAAIYGVEERAIVMELVEGATLAGPLPIKTALDYARQIAVALEAAHEKGIIHRDLKPANVKITPDGVAKVLDFGLAKLTEDPAASNASNSPTLTMSPTHLGAILGTAAYMAPEQARGEVVDKRADIWAFGTVLYEMLAGKPAFAGESTSDILAAVLRSEPDWSALPAATPPGIRQLLRRCVERDRKQRLRDIGEARITIEQFLANPNEAAAPAIMDRPAQRWGLAAGVAAILVAAAALGGWWMVPRPKVLPWLRLSLDLGADTPLARGAAGDGFTLSPDGRHVAFVTSSDNGTRRLALRPLNQNQTTLLPDTDGASQPFFSADSQWIAFFAAGKLKRISVTGGAAVSLCGSDGGPGGSWGDDGNIIVALTPSGGLWRVPAIGGLPIAVTELDKEKGERTHRFPQVLPGSQVVLFTSHTARGDYNDANIEAVSLKNGQRKTIVRGGFLGRYVPTGHLIYVHDATLFAVPFDVAHLTVTGSAVPLLDDVRASASSGDLAISETGALIHISGKGSFRSAIFWLNNTDKLEPLRPASGNYGSPRFSPDGKRLAFVTRTGQSQEIWVQDLERNGVTSHLTSTGSAPVWTQDDKYVVFKSGGRLRPGIYAVRADGASEPKRLMEGAPGALPSSFSPDGRWLAGRADDGIWIAPVEADRDGLQLGKSEPFLRGSGEFYDPRFSPDGHWIAYMWRETGPREVFVRPFPRPPSDGGGRWQVSTGNGGTPVWSRNGHELFFQGQEIMVVDYKANGDTFIPRQARRWSERRWRAPSMGFALFDLAPDGKRMAAVMYEEDAAERKPTTHLSFLENFFDELRQRVPAGGK